MATNVVKFSKNKPKFLSIKWIIVGFTCVLLCVYVGLIDDYFIHCGKYLTQDANKVGVDKDLIQGVDKSVVDKDLFRQQWGECIFLVFMTGLIGYAFYIIKSIYDLESYERKKNLELDRKVYQEQEAYKLNLKNNAYQKVKDRRDFILRIKACELDEKKAFLTSMVFLDKVTSMQREELDNLRKRIRDTEGDKDKLNEIYNELV